jgi:hypothetical protein
MEPRTAAVAHWPPSDRAPFKFNGTIGKLKVSYLK